MHAIEGTWKNGQVVLSESANWPDGCRVMVEPLACPSADERLGLSEEDWPRTPEQMNDWLRWFDSIEPVEMSAEEEAEWQNAQKAVKEFSIANQKERIERLCE